MSFIYNRSRIYKYIHAIIYIWHILIPFCNTYNSVFPNIHFPTIEKRTLSKLQKKASNNENIRRTFLVEVLHCLRQVGYGICFTGNGLVEMFLFRGWPTDVLGWETNIETYGEGRYLCWDLWWELLELPICSIFLLLCCLLLPYNGSEWRLQFEDWLLGFCASFLTCRQRVEPIVYQK